MKQFTDEEILNMINDLSGISYVSNKRDSIISYQLKLDMMHIIMQRAYTKGYIDGGNFIPEKEYEQN